MYKYLFAIIFFFLIFPILSFASIDVNLSYGSRGGDVVELQNFLISKGFLMSGASGNFLSLTRKAVISYQRSLGLYAVGFVGPLTREKINAELSFVALPTSAVPAQTGSTDSKLLLQKQIEKLISDIANLNKQVSDLGTNKQVAIETPVNIQSPVIVQPTQISTTIPTQTSPDMTVPQTTITTPTVTVPVVQEYQPKNKGNRVIGMDVSQGSLDFQVAFAVAQGAGVKAVEMPIAWDDYELKPKEYTTSFLAIADYYYPSVGVKIGISINPIDTNVSRLPTDLKGKSFSDPEVISRYKAFVDFVANSLKNSNIYFVAIGNEIDIYLGNSNSKWKDYSDFYNAVAPYVKQKFPNASVGGKITFQGIMQYDSNVRLINKNADVIMTTYYPFETNTNFVSDPKIVHTDFKRIVDLYPDKQIYFTEIGYPTSAVNKSSEQKQADFIKETFRAWDTYSDKIPFLDFIWLHDVASETVAGWQSYYGLQDPAFSSYLGSLGLRTYGGVDKLGFIQLKKESKDRGW